MVARFIHSKSWPHERYLYGSLAVAAVLLIGLTSQVALTARQPSHSNLALYLLKMTVVVPEIAIWLLAALSTKRFKCYALSIKSEPDGRHMNVVANGLLWLVGYIVSLCLASPIHDLLLSGRHAYAATVLTNHLPIILVLVASAYIFVGSRGLAGLTRADFWNRRNTLRLLVPFALLMVVFIADFYLEAPRLRDIAGNLRFALPVYLLLVTYVLPHLVVWVLGLLSGFNLWWFVRHIEGAIYKILFAKIQQGLTIIFMAIFLAQLLICSPYAAANFQIGITLIYALLVLTIVGYSLIFKGIRQLQNLEDII